MRPIRLATALLTLLTVATPALAETVAERWASARTPAAGPAEAIGSAAAGCVAGARPLPLSGEGYQVLRPSRNRAWSHPQTVAFLRDLAAKAHRDGLPLLLIGDMSQPRGGPLPFGHASHQNGLDVDLWFRMPHTPLSAAELEEPKPQMMVRDGGIDPDAWGPAQVRLLELAAKAPGVDRMFVHPAIKQALCASLPPERRSWLGKLRPWWGHDEHVHIRLACPADSPRCEPQPPPPEGEGCGEELLSWLARPTAPTPHKRTHRPPQPMPEACATLRP